MIPISTLIVITKGLSILLVKNEKKEWTLPGGHPDPRVEEVESIKDFARAALFPFFKGLIIRSVRLLIPPIDGMVLGEDRARVAVFECEVEGDSQEAESKGLAWFAPIKCLPPHAVAPDICGIIETIAAQDRFSEESPPKK